MMNRGSRVPAVAGLLAGIIFALWTAPAEAQIPDKFTNLKVLPKDIGKQELVDTMRGYASALGVRCGFCHARPDGNPSAEFDWASDAKPEKTTARIMMQMVELINTKELPKVTVKRATEDDVSCRTCHHGLSRPALIEDVLADEYKAGGFDSLSTKYESLRKEYYGTDSYNFGEEMLPQLGEKLAGRDDPQLMLKFVEYNLRWFPDSGSTYLALGQVHAMLGDRKTAMENAQKAMELDPAIKEHAERFIRSLQGTGGKPD